MTFRNDKSALELFRLLQLTSSNLPVGGYTFSQGLEYAIDAGWLTTAAQVQQWIEQTSTATLIYSDLPLIIRQYQCVKSKNWALFSHWNNVALAIRESKELLLADVAMGEALLRLAKNMHVELPDDYISKTSKIAYVSVYSALACHMNLSVTDACSGHCWTIIENQVMAATKLLPMGQTAAQALLYELSEAVQDCVTHSSQIADDEIGLSLPGLAMASAKHETQYSRLYRS